MKLHTSQNLDVKIIWIIKKASKSKIILKVYKKNFVNKKLNKERINMHRKKFNRNKQF